MNQLRIVFTLLLFALGLACSRQEAPPPAKAPAPVASAPVAAAAPVAAPDPGWHADHDPKHGGLLFMADNIYHHLEGTYAEAGVFRLYLYDDYTKPIDAQGTSGFVTLKGATNKIPLAYDAATQTLVAQLAPPPALPFELQLTVSLMDPKTQTAANAVFNFPFTAIGGEKAVAHDHAAGGHSHAPGETHEHVAPHGGQVATVGADHHFELVNSGGMLTLWILDAHEKTLSVERMSARILLQPSSGPAVTLDMPAMRDVHFMANSPLKPGETGSAIATVVINGKALNARFTLGAAP